MLSLLNEALAFDSLRERGLSFCPMQGALFKVVLLFSFSMNLANAVEIPVLYAKDKIWLQSVCKRLIKDLEGVKNAYDFEEIFEVMKDSLLGRMLPHVDEKRREYRVLLERKNEKIGNQKELDVAIARYKSQLEYLAYELKKMGFSEMWNSKLSTLENIDAILLRVQYRRNGVGDIAFNSAGVALLREEPSSTSLELLRKSLKKRIQDKHAGDVKAFYDRTLSKLGTNSNLLYLVYGRENFKF